MGSCKGATNEVGAAEGRPEASLIGLLESERAELQEPCDLSTRATDSDPSQRVTLAIEAKQLAKRQKFRNSAQ